MTDAERELIEAALVFFNSGEVDYRSPDASEFNAMLARCENACERVRTEREKGRADKEAQRLLELKNKLCGESWMARHSPYAKAIDYAAARLRGEEAAGE